MTDEHVERLRVAAERFREGIEATNFGDLAGNLKDFPRRCCHHAAKLLGLYLFEQGMGCFQVVGGRRGRDGTEEHVWLERDGVMVDITVDQFRDWPGSKVFVSTVSDWHSLWRRAARPPVACDAEYYGRIREHYDEEYRRILEALRE